jgi:hypothetical protein
MKKTLLLVFVLSLASVVAVGCGSKKKKKKSGSTAPVAVTIEQTGGKKDAKLKAPASVKAGLATITLKNSSQADGNAQLVRVEGNHSTDEALKAGNSWAGKGTPLPDWIKLEGGIGAVRPGQTTSVTQDLPGGKYLVLNTDSESNPRVDMEVTGSGSGSAPSEAAKIDAVDYSFTGTGLKQGKQKVLFDNKGKQPHFIVSGPLSPGKTIEDAKKAAQQEEGPPPFDEKSMFSTAILEGGSKQVVDIDFKKPGKWVALCFIPDRQGGPPHVAKGMVSELTVK